MLIYDHKRIVLLSAALIRAVKLTEKLHLNCVLKYDQYWILKGIISVSVKKAFVFSPEATRGRIEQNITNARNKITGLSLYIMFTIMFKLLKQLETNQHHACMCSLIQRTETNHKEHFLHLNT